MVAAPEVEEELLLPPADGDEDDNEALGDAEDADDVTVPGDAHDPYDDALADESAFADPIDVVEEASALGDDETGVGDDAGDAVAAREETGLLGDDDPLGVEGEDFGLEEDPRDGEKDSGEEGFEEAEEELRAEDLPDLDADEEGEAEDDLFFEDLPREGEGLPWDDRGWDVAFAGAIGNVTRLRVHAAVEAWLADGRMLRLRDATATFTTADDQEPEPHDDALVVKGRVRAMLREGTGVLRALGEGPLVPLAGTAEATGFDLRGNDGEVVAAVPAPEGRVLLILISAEGDTRVVADVSATADAAGEDARVAAVAADARGKVWVGGPFGVLAFVPRPRRAPQ